MSPGNDATADDAPPAVELDARGWPILHRAEPVGSVWERHDDPEVEQ